MLGKPTDGSVPFTTLDRPYIVDHLTLWELAIIAEKMVEGIEFSHLIEREGVSQFQCC